MASKMLGEATAPNADRPEDDARVGEEVEEYDCGCKVHFRKLDYREARDEAPGKPLVVPEYLPCSRHKGVQSIPPRDSRLVKVRREYESFLNE
jgi:hypothetical protein